MWCIKICQHRMQRMWASTFKNFPTCLRCCWSWNCCHFHHLDAWPQLLSFLATALFFEGASLHDFWPIFQNH